MEHVGADADPGVRDADDGSVRALLSPDSGFSASARPGELDRVVQHVVRQRHGNRPGPAFAAVLMSASTVIVGVNAQLLRRAQL